MPSRIECHALKDEEREEKNSLRVEVAVQPLQQVRRRQPEKPAYLRVHVTSQSSRHSKEIEESRMKIRQNASAAWSQSH